MRTDLETEKAFQRLWKPKPRFENLTLIPGLIKNEFRDTQARNRIQNGALQNLIRFVTNTVPYYKSLFEKLNLSWTDIKTPQDLPRLPILDRKVLTQAGKNMIATRQPNQNKASYKTKTSGSTGNPVIIVQSAGVGLMYLAIKQRELRWLRADPMKTFATIINSNNVSMPGMTKETMAGKDTKVDGWRYVGNMFETGTSHIYLNENPVQDQINWLLDVNADYFACMAEDLENMAMVFDANKRPENLKWIQATSQDLNLDMRRTIDAAFDVPVHQNYGLNEIGMVATRCATGKKYHTNWEHCIVEIIDDDGMPVPVGVRGRIVVTSLSNWAMPLIRYDTGDIGEAADDECPCGRNMPSFANIHGRYRRLAFLPESTASTRSFLRDILRELPDSTKQLYSRTQLHQDKDVNYTLIFETNSDLPAQMTDEIHQRWADGMAQENREHSLTIKQTKKIEYAKGGKFQNFTSHFIPAPSTNFEDN